LIDGARPAVSQVMWNTCLTLIQAIRKPTMKHTKTAQRSHHGGLRLLPLAQAVAVVLATLACAQPALARSVIVSGDVTPTFPAPADPWDVVGTIVVGNNGTGTLDIEGGGTVSSNQAFVGWSAGSDGTVTVSGVGSTWTNAGTFLIGDTGNGTFTVEQGGAVSSTGTVTLGLRDGSTGLLTVTGPGSLWKSFSQFIMGDGGSGELNVLDGGKVESVTSFIGSGLAGGSVTVSGADSSWINSGQLLVGSRGPGTLTIADGGRVSNTAGFVGAWDGGVGIVTVTGAGSHWTNSEDLYLGLVGAGTLTIEKNGQVTSPSVTMGTAAGATGTLNLQGDSTTGRGVLSTGQISKELGSATLNLNGGILQATQNQSDYLSGFSTLTVAAEGAWFATAGFDIGIGTAFSSASDSSFNKQGAGTLTLSGDSSAFGGATRVTAGTLEITNRLGSSGAVVDGTVADGATIKVKGSSAAWVNAAAFTIGWVGSNTGALIIEDGGQVSNTFGTIASRVGSRGTITVSGAGSLWTNSDHLIVGYYGDATLTVEKGGEVAVAPAITMALHSQSRSTLNLTGDSINGRGVVSTGQLISGPGSATLNLNGGILRATQDQSDYLSGFSTLAVGSEGVWFDTAGFDISVDTAFQSVLPSSFNKLGAGTLMLSGDSSAFSGRTTVSGGALVVTDKLGGDLATVSNGRFQVDGRFSGDVVAQAAGTLAGSGTIDGDVAIARDAVLAGAQGQTLAIGGNLRLVDGGVINVMLGGAPAAALFDVAGNLILDGTLNVTDQGGFGVGVYRLFDYAGTLTDDGLAIGLMPNAVAPGDFAVQTSAAHQVNLVSAAGATLGFWDGGDTTRHHNGVIDGGAGAWRADGDNWTDADAAVNGAFQPNPTFAIFQGAAGTVTVDDAAGAIGVTGMQFATDGYRIEGDAIALQGEDGETIVRVGTGATSGAGMTATLASALTGASRLVKSDFGTLVLAGNNTYSGGTELRAGVLSVSSDAHLGDASGGLTFSGGTLASTASFDTSRAITLTTTGTVDAAAGSVLTLHGVIDGAGTLVKTGAGNVSLTQANTYAGGTQVQGGNLTLMATGGLGAGAVKVSGAGSLLDFLAVGATPVTAQSLTIHNENRGSTYFRGTSSAADATLFNSDGGSTVFLHDASAGNANLVNLADGVIWFVDQSSAEQAHIINNADGLIEFFGSSTADLATLQNNAGGTVDISALGSTGIGMGSLSGAGAVVLGNKTLTLGGLDQNDTIAGVISDGRLAGGGLTKIGSGVLRLEGINTYTGATTVNAGSLLVAGSIASSSMLNIASGSLLGGSGTVGNTNIAASGSLMPGDVSAALTINGNLTMAAGSHYQVFADPTSANSSRANVTGTATLAGGTVMHVGPDGSYQAGIGYTILTANQGVIGTFEQVQSTYAYLTPSLAYSTNAVTMELVRRDMPVEPTEPTVPTRPMHFADAANTSNQRATANALESLGNGDGLYRRIETLPEGAPPAVFDNLSGEIHASTGAALQSTAAVTRALSFKHLRGHLAAMAEPGTTSVKADDLPAWAEVVGKWLSMDGNDNAASAAQRTSGLFGGADRVIGNAWRMGGVLGYTDSTLRVDGRNSKSRISSYSATLYAGKAFEAGTGKLNLLIGGGYTWHDIDSQRSIAAAGLSQVLTADYRGSTRQMATELGYALPMGATTLEPFAGVARSQLNTGAFSEFGGSAALRGQAKTEGQTSTTLGVRFETRFMQGQSKSTVRGSLGWGHALGSIYSQSTLAFHGSQPFSVAGTAMARNVAMLELSADVAISRNATLGVSYTGQFGDGSRENAGSVNLLWRF
jgi:fibronectin-binding autotransporter adhesin